MKYYAQLTLVPVLFSLPLPLLAGGNLDAPAPPGDAGSAMYTLEDIYNRLNDGTVGTKRSGAFVEPGSGPTVQGKTLDEVMGKAPAKDNTNGAEPSDVVNGKTYWGLTDGNWGLKTGTYPNAAVEKTGQTTSYATGDDGDLQKGIAWPNPRFTDNNSDGTVTDNLTGLIWLKNANCFGAKNWTTALSDANNLSNGTCGLSDGSSAGDWRLPNRKELFSLIDDEYFSPALSNAAGTAKWTDGDAFTGVQAFNYWSSTTYVVATSYAWSVDLDSGSVDVNGKSGTCYVWPVRGGQ